MAYYNLPGFDGIEVYVPSSWPGGETFALNVRECLERIRRLRTGDILLNQIKYAQPAARTAAHDVSPDAQSLNFDPRTMVIIMPTEVDYVQSGNLMFGGRAYPSPSLDHNPPGSRFYRRGGSAATTEPIDHVYAEWMGFGSKALIRFNNAIMGYQISTPAFIILAHELIHANHYLHGYREGDSRNEELRTIGAGRWRGASEPLVSENALRREASLPTRYEYSR